VKKLNAIKTYQEFIQVTINKMIAYLIIITSFLIDFSSKKIVLNNLIWEIKIIWDYLKIKLVNNTWIAFSIPLSWLILKIITILLIVWIWYYYYQFEKKKQVKLLDIAYALILGWAIGNGIDRIFNWFVVDFVSIKYFAIFNFADIFINIWMILLIFYYMQMSWKNKK